MSRCQLRSYVLVPAAWLVVLALAGTAAGPAAAQDRERRLPPPAGSELRGTPGFVDFAELGVDAPGELAVGIALSGPILRLVAEATRGEEPGFAELIEKLQGIFARVYEVPAHRRGSVERVARSAIRQLERRGWHTVVELHGDGDSSYLQIRTEGDLIRGLAVIFVEADGTTGFINVVGNITPEEVGRLGRTFDIDALERFDRSGESGADR